MPDPQTIRDHLKAQEAILEEMAAEIRYDLWKPGIGVVHKVAELREHAVAALDLLDNAESDMFDHEGGKVRLVPDYQPGIDPEHCAPGWVEPDPAPSGDAE